MNECITFFLKVFTDLAEKGEKYILNKKYLKATYYECVTKPKQRRLPPVEKQIQTELPTDL